MEKDPQVLIQLIMANCPERSGKISSICLLLACFCLLRGSGALVAQPAIRSEYISQDDGLASNYVFCFLQDRQGFMWIGTQNGLNRYDGRRFLEFRFDPEDPQTLNSNWISALLEDKQNRIWVGTRAGLNRLDKENGEIERVPFFSAEGQPVQAWVQNLFEDDQQNIWISTREKGLFRLSSGQHDEGSKAMEFRPKDAENESEHPVEVNGVVFQQEERLWLTTPRGLEVLDTLSRNLEKHHFPGQRTGNQDEIQRFNAVWDGRHRLFKSRVDSLFVIDLKAKEPQLLSLEGYFPSRTSKDLAGGPFRSLLMQGEDTLLVVRRYNLLWIDLKTGDHTLIRNEGETGVNLASTSISNIFLDKSGNIWVGTHGNGLIILTRRLKPFRFYQHDPSDPQSISPGPVRSFSEDGAGHLWAAILNYGLDQFTFGEDQRLEKTKSIPFDPDRSRGLSDGEVIQIAHDPQGNIWIATNRGGLNKMDAETGEVEVYFDGASDPSHQIGDNRIWALEVDRHGTVWTGGWQEGLYRIDPAGNVVKHYRSGPDPSRHLISDQVRALYLEEDSILWIGTLHGLSRMNTVTETFTHFSHDLNDPHSLSNNLIWAVFADSRENVWIGTSIGLNRLDPASGRVERYYENDGLPSHSVYGLVEDNSGVLWISTEDGLARKVANGAETHFIALGAKDGLGSASFLPKATFRHETTGHLYFGASEGIVVIDPSRLSQERRKPELVLHDVSTLNHKAQGSPLIVNPFLQEMHGDLVLKPADRVLEFTLSDLSWQFSGSLHYEYQLEGFNDLWMPLGGEMKMTFTNLEPGNYILRARGKTLDNFPFEAETLLHIKVLPPWYERSWAYISFLLLGAGLIYFFHRFQLNRQLEKQETENLRTLNEVKNTLYTNITHEFRTPLTVISGMAKQIQGQKKIKKLIRRNCANLLNLVDQMLELRKLETGRLPLNLVQADIVPYLSYIVSSFESLAKIQNISLHYLPKEHEFFMDFDREKVLRILSNLLSNAIKFSKDGGNIFVILERSFLKAGDEAQVEALQVSVTDQGIGIPFDQQSLVFGRYYQVRSTGDPDPGQNPKFKERSADHLRQSGGTGIGLALTRELVKRMGGQIQLKSAVDHGTTVQFRLPIERKQALVDLKTKEIIEGLPEHSKPSNLAQAGSPQVLPPLGIKHDLSLLIIEDSTDIQQYLISFLEGEYNLLLANDGEEGIQMAFDHIPDLVISDVLMPKLDGFEVCSQLKQDARTSHIPIVLLTAKADTESRIQGLERGADAYLAKPFNENELRVRLRMLIQLRKKLQQRYKGLDKPSMKVSTDDDFHPEDDFMSKLHQVVDDNIHDPDFGTSQLCQKIGMSRSQLHLKIKALTKRSTSNFIRTIRLHRAKQLLQSSRYNVQEAAYEVGFKDPSYFSRKFTEEFGVNPKTVIKH